FFRGRAPALGFHSSPPRRSSDLGPGDRSSLRPRPPAPAGGRPEVRPSQAPPAPPPGRRAPVGAGRSLQRSRRLRSPGQRPFPLRDRKSTRLNSSHVKTSYAVLCL